uniref:At1g61320/AtMIF1 LRR domain-containing protein n=2 Tax=Oryza brachyantha TaxID=4533 RepID=J3MYX5_ORYBR
MKDTPLLPTKFLHLKHLTISLSAWTFSPNYDYFSLVSYLDASPLLEVFILAISQECIESESIFESCSHLRQMPEYRHEHLNSATISGFCSGKSLVELTCHIVENTTSLECLTLDTTHGDGRCSGNGSSLCSPASQSVLMESPRTLLAVRRYIEGKIPPGVKLNVVELCRLCTRCDALLR